LVHALPQTLDHLRTQAKCRFRQTQKNIFKIDQTCPNALGFPKRPRTSHALGTARKPVQEIIALDISTYGNKSIHPTPSQPANAATKNSAAIFRRSFAKVQRMARVVIEEQFVSFIC
jgi:hypothetical protein